MRCSSGCKMSWMPSLAKSMEMIFDVPCAPPTIVLSSERVVLCLLLRWVLQGYTDVLVQCPH